MLTLPAELTTANAAATLQASLAARAATPAPAPCTVDASGVQQFDSSALAVLLALHRQAAQTGTPWQVCGANADMQGLAQLYGVQELLFG